MCQDITHLIQLGGLTALSGYDQRSTRLVNQYRVHLVDNGIIQIPQHHLLFVDRHIITKIVKTQLIVRHIGDITVISLFPLLRGHGIKHHSYGQPQKLMDLSHPLRITLSQIVIDRDDVDSLAIQRIQICRRCGYQSLSFTGPHLRDSSLMQHDTADQLYREMLHIQSPARRFPNRSKCLRQNIIQSFPCCQTLLKYPGIIT